MILEVELVFKHFSSFSGSVTFRHVKLKFIIMKKLLSIFAIAIGVVLIAPACSQDESFDEIIENSDLDQQSTTDQEEDMTEKPGSN